jgi:hypothetical protein
VSQGNGHVERRRDVAHERAFTAAAAHLVERSPGPIRELAETRAPMTPIEGFALRDFGMEGLEEGADWRNYLCWHALQLDLAGRTDPPALAARAALARALAHVIEAFAEHDLARRLVALDTAHGEA